MGLAGPKVKTSATGGGDAVAPRPDGAKPSAKGSRRWLRWLLLGGLYATVALTLLFSIQLIRYTIRFPDPRALSINEAGPTIRVLARDGTVIAERGERNDFVHLDRLPRHLVNAVIATEDRRFFEHWGLDPSGLARAMLANLRAGRTVQGGSTLTQQLAKNLFLTQERTLSRKLEELILSVWLEIRLTKREILELYLNRVYFGGGAYGVEAASRRFFEKPARAVTVAEAAVIAGLLKAPSKYSPFANPGHARARARVVLRAMQAAGFLTPVARAAAARYSVRFADPQAGRRPTGLEYAVDYVLDQLPPVASVGRREIIVETTIDAALQKHAQATITGILERDGRSASVDQAAMVVLDTSGGIRALVGGRSFAASQYNRAVKSRRQPGSAFKPFVYLAAIEQGMGPDTVVVDQPLDIDGWSPRNDDGRYRGPVTLRSALAHSVNTTAVRLQQEIGTSRVTAIARRLGIESRLRPDASLALGTSEVGLLEISGAYAVLAAGGAGIEPHAITRVRIGNGPALLERKDARPRMIVAPDIVGTMNTMLNGVIVSGTGRRAALPRHQAAGKTGTTQDFRDAWFVGYTAHLAAGVWFGNDDGRPMSRIAGGGLPAEVWRKIMLVAHEKLPPRALPAIDLMHEPAAPVARSNWVSGPSRVASPGSAAASPPPLPERPDASRREAATATLLSGTARIDPAPPASPPPAAHPAPRSPAPPRPKPTSPPATAARPTTESQPAQRPLHRTPRMPSESIDPELFRAALAGDGPPTPTASPTVGAPVPSAPPQAFDPRRVHEALGGVPERSRMSLGAPR